MAGTCHTLEPFLLGAYQVKPGLVLAPMMNITGYAFRALVREYGGCGLFYSEMLNSRRVPQEKNNALIFKGFGQEPDLILQLLGDDPDYLAAAIDRLESFSPLGYDLNMGCTRAAIMRHGWGAALLHNPAVARDCLRAMRKATRRILTVKIRMAWETKEEFKAFVHMLAAEGADAIILHARNLDKRFARPAKWEWIRQAKQWLAIPLIGNGDIVDACSAWEMQQQTACDGVMIGRAAIRRPMIFWEICNCSAKQTWRASDVFKGFIRHLGDELDQPKRFAELRAFCEYFALGLPVPHWFWGPMQSAQNSTMIIRQATAFFEKYNL